MIVLNGTVVDENDVHGESIAITEAEIPAYEAKGYSIGNIVGQFFAMTFEPHPDGTIQITPRLDSKGRYMVANKHANVGYSGYWLGYLFVGGKRRTIKGWTSLFPNEENRYNANYKKRDAKEKTIEIVEALKGKAMTKVKGGYQLIEAENQR